MKMKKLISFILSLTIIISTLAGFTVVNAANFAERNLTNVAVNSNFNEAYDSDLWALSSTAEGSSLKIVDDTKDTSETNKNKVLRFDGTDNTKTASYINYRGASSSKKYYMSFKVRLADNYDDVNDGKDDLYIIPNQLYNADYKDLTMPKITKDEWTICSGVITPGTSTTCDGLIGFKVSYKQDNTSTYNVKKAIYEIDDFELCEITSDFMKISLPAGVSVVSGGFSCVEKGTSATYVNYVKKQTDVVLKYENASKVLSSEQVEIKKNDVEYSFTMPNENVTITLAEPPVFTNLIANGNMENKNLPHKWNKGSNANGAEITIEKESDTSENHVLRFDGTNIGDNKVEIEENRNDNPMSYMSYADKLKAGRYYYSYKIKKVSGTSSTNKFYAYNSSFYSSTNNLMYKPEINENWITRSGICTTSAESSFNFKIINNQADSKSNVPDVIYDLDNVIVYDFTDVYEIELPAKTNIAEGGKRLDVTVATEEGGWVPVQTPKYYAKAGDTVKLEYTGNKALKIEGAEYTLDGNVYTFTMPALATYNDKLTVTEVENITFDEAEIKIKVARPKSFVLVAAKYDEEDMSLDEAYTANYETTAINQDVTLSDIEEFKAITDWTDMRIFVWSNFTDIIPLCDTFICAQ